MSTEKGLKDKLIELHCKITAVNPEDIKLSHVIFFWSSLLCILSLILADFGLFGSKYQEIPSILWGLYVQLFIAFIIVICLLFVINLFLIFLSSNGEEGDATVRGLGILVGLLVIGYGVLEFDRETEYNDAVDGLNEANDNLDEAGGGEYTVDPGEKRYNSYIILLVGVIIVFFYLVKGL